MSGSRLVPTVLSETELSIAARLALSMMDLTSLNDDDSEHGIQALCPQASTPFGSVAAICVYPHFINTVHTSLNSLGLSQQVAIATVVNFPHGLDSIAHVQLDIRAAMAAGAQEIDLVLPYRQLMAGDSTFALTMVQAAKTACVEANTEQPTLLKVIIESGELPTAELITQASKLAINGGANFIKSSTGKVAVNVTLSAAS